MSEQAPKLAPEMITVPDWSERQPAPEAPVPYDLLAKEIAKEDDPVKQREEIVDLLKQAYADAEAGTLVTERVNQDKTVTRNAYDTVGLFAQLRDFETLANNPKDANQDILLRVPSANGLRRAFLELAGNAHTSYAMMDALREVQKAKQAELFGETKASTTELEPADRQEVQQGLGETAVEAVVPSPELSAQQQLDALVQNLSEDDKAELRSYAVNHEMMREAQQEGNGPEAQERQQYKGQALRAMSPAAQAVASQYLQLYLQT